jgi:hypothetical protein
MGIEPIGTGLKARGMTGPAAPAAVERITEFEARLKPVQPAPSRHGFRWFSFSLRRPLPCRALPEHPSITIVERSAAMSRNLLVVCLLALDPFSACRADEAQSQSTAAVVDAPSSDLAAKQESPSKSQDPVKPAGEASPRRRAQEEELPPGFIYVFAKDEAGVSLLKDARIRSIGGRSFVVGREAEDPNKITKSTYAGNVVWIPLDNVLRMVEIPNDGK